MLATRAGAADIPRMLTATTSEIASDYAAWQARARGQLVEFIQEGRPIAVILSAEEYRRLKRLDRQALLVEELDDATLAALAATEPSEEAAAFNAETI